MCRVCGKKAKTYLHNKESEKCKPLLLATFGVDVESEDKEIYPSSVCNNCYRSMQRIRTSQETGVHLNSQLSLSSWLPHSDESCPTCNDTVHKSKGKSAGQGRPHNDDITHLSRETMRAVNNINPPQFSEHSLESHHFLPSEILQSLLCKHCNCIPNRPLELLPCHHLRSMYFMHY